MVLKVPLVALGMKFSVARDERYSFVRNLAIASAASSP
jgi:hypothetical protein